MEKKTIFIIIIILGIFVSTIVITGEKMTISKEKAIEIANNEARKLGWELEIRNIQVTKYNTPWNDYLIKDSMLEYDIERQKKLEGKEYWAVCYVPKEMILAGNLCIFVDAQNGKIITTSMEK